MKRNGKRWLAWMLITMLLVTIMPDRQVWAEVTQNKITKIVISGIDAPVHEEQLDKTATVTFYVGDNSIESGDATVSWKVLNIKNIENWPQYKEVGWYKGQYIPKVEFEVPEGYDMDDDVKRVEVLDDKTEREITNNFVYWTPHRLPLAQRGAKFKMITDLEMLKDITLSYEDVSDFDKFMDIIPKKVSAKVDNNNEEETKELDIVWEEEEEEEESIQAEYEEKIKDKKQGSEITVSGKVNIPKGYVLDQNIDQTVSVKIIVDAVPQVMGIDDGKTYCKKVTFKVSDNNLKDVTINGESAGIKDSYTLKADKQNTKYTVIATDSVGNEETVTVTVNKEHTWDKGSVTKKATSSKSGTYTCKCQYCKEKKTSKIPKTSMSMEWNKEYKLKDIIGISYDKITVPNASKYKPYLHVNHSKGTIKVDLTTKYKIKKKIPVEITVDGIVYERTIDVIIPAPKVKITKSREYDSERECYKYKYKLEYNVKGADRVQVRCKELNEKEDIDVWNTLFHSANSKDNPYRTFSFREDQINKYGCKLTFMITAFYGENGENQSEVRTIKK